MIPSGIDGHKWLKLRYDLQYRYLEMGMKMSFRKIFKRLDKPDSQAIILLYHRISVCQTDPWKLCVSPEHFNEQLEQLRSTFTVVPLHGLPTALQEKGQRIIAITFDDGYLDNYTAARPLLERHQLPATFFISTHWTDRSRMFWWDELASLILIAPALPQKMSFPLPGNELVFDVEEEALLGDDLMRKISRWKYPEKPTCRRLELFLALWQAMKSMPIQEQENLLDVISIKAGSSPDAAGIAHVMSSEQICRLAEHPLFDIGVHTLTHPVLSALPVQGQRDEIQQCALQLKKATGFPARFLAYPFGNYNRTSETLARQMGFRASLTTNPQPVTAKTNVHRWGRVPVPDTGGTSFGDFLHKFFV